ncbi:TPA: hypothetical protein ACGQVR_005787 [Klebsiella michiganensis]|nr:hypothetical protein [Klebsiella michiganensis]HDN2684914.1 hypothetical protein [Klebsiella michiganensis]HDX8889303.1 hypothetical protein [Klebsiella michiganensis]
MTSSKGLKVESTLMFWGQSNARFRYEIVRNLDQGGLLVIIIYRLGTVEVHKDNRSRVNIGFSQSAPSLEKTWIFVDSVTTHKNDIADAEDFAREHHAENSFSMSAFT